MTKSYLTPPVWLLQTGEKKTGESETKLHSGLSETLLLSMQSDGMKTE